MTTNFVGGATNAPPGGVNQTLPVMDDTVNFQFFDDFIKFNAVATTGAADWVQNATGAATGVVSDAAGGILTLTNTASNADVSAYQWKGQDATTDVAEVFGALDLSKEFWFKTRFSLADATNTAFFAGLIATNTTPFTAIANGIYLSKPAGAAQLNFVLAKASALTTVSFGSGGVLTNGAFINAGFHYTPNGINGNGMFTLYANDQRVASTQVLTNVPIVTLAPSFGIQNGTAGAKTAQLDYILAVAPRATP